MYKILAACGNDCSVCPRYVTHPYEKTEEELRRTAELWAKIGYRDHIVTNEEIACTGCRPENQCRYHVVKCCEEKGIHTCAECDAYPCETMKECFRITKSFEPMCRKVCTDEEFDQLKRAFLEKEVNLNAARNTPGHDSLKESPSAEVSLKESPSAKDPAKDKAPLPTGFEKPARSKYRVITLCGSTRFKDAFMEAQKRLTLEGNIVISVGLFGHSGDDEVWTEGTKEMLDDMHLRKIDMADEIFVINVGGYIGSSTRREIEYAKRTGKAVRYLE